MVSPPNTVCVTTVTTLPCEIFITTLRMLVHKYIGNTNTLFTLDQISVSK